MCGIAGFAGPKRPGDRASLGEMARRMIHRGPDSMGEYESPAGSMVVRRLAVRGGPAANQPLLSRDGSIAVAGNGEIYNYPELHRDLSRRGHSFRTTSDLEVILHLYEECGSGLWGELIGDFAAVVIDNRSRTVVLARDRLGIRPLYVTEVAGRLAYSSEIRPLLAVMRGSAAASTAGLALYLQHQFVPAPLTAFDGIYKLNPGTQLVIRDGGITEHRYWSPSQSLPSSEGTDHRAEELAWLLGDAVRRQGGTADGPVGISLSGGVDSAVIAALHQTSADHPLTAFTIDFPAPWDAGHSEAEAAAALAGQLGIKHVAVCLSAESYLEAATRAVRTLEEPICDPTAGLLDRISAEAADRGIRVLLSGEGADELYGGYAQYGRSAAGERAWVGGRRLLKSVFDSSPWPDRLRLSGDAPAELPLTRVLGRGDEETAGILRAAVTRCEPGGSTTELLCHYGRDDLRGFVPSTLLARGDKICMANSVEGRFPYLDHRVVEHGLSIHADHKISGRTNKVALRALACDLGIASAGRAAKSPFSLPMADWLTGPLRGVVADLLRLARADPLELQPARWLPELIAQDGHLTHRATPSDVWSVYSLLAWADTYLR